MFFLFFFFFFKQKTAYEMSLRDWSSDVCSSDLIVEDQKVRVAMLPVGESRIELLEPTSDDSPISKFLVKRGAGVHHIAFGVDDIHAALADLKSKGTRLIDEEPRPGSGGCLVAFIHPSST